jgi:hypothetical protein
LEDEVASFTAGGGGSFCGESVAVSTAASSFLAGEAVSWAGDGGWSFCGESVVVSTGASSF